MNANLLVDTLHDAGLSIALTPERGLKVSPASVLTPELRDLIRASKTVLIDLLERMKKAGDTAAPWRVSVAPGTPPHALACLRSASLALDKLQALEPSGFSEVSTEIDGFAVVRKTEVRSEVRTEMHGSDRLAWPYSTAMNDAELETFAARLVRFTDRGLILADGELLADKLVIRDREGDDRRVCLECLHLQHGRCGDWQVAGVAIRSRDAQLSPDLVLQLQRCDGFAPEAPNATTDSSPVSTAETPF